MTSSPSSLSHHTSKTNTAKYLEMYSALNRLLSSSPQTKPPAKQLAMTLVHQILQGGGTAAAQNAGGSANIGVSSSNAANSSNTASSNAPSERSNASKDTSTKDDRHHHHHHHHQVTDSDETSEALSADTKGNDTAQDSSSAPHHLPWPHLKRTCLDILKIVKSQMKEANTAKRRNMLWVLVALAVMLHMREVYGGGGIASKELQSAGVASSIQKRHQQKSVLDAHALTPSHQSTTSTTLDGHPPTKSSRSSSTATSEPTTLSNLSVHFAPPPDHDYSNEMTQIISFLTKIFADRDAKVRFSACEAMYNICNIFRDKILYYFRYIFDGTCRLAGDTDHLVRNANVLLTRLLKDIVAEDYNFDVEEFISLIKDMIHSNNPYNRQFLLEWILLLNAVPDIQLIAYLPSFLGGVFEMCADQNHQITLQAQNALEQFLADLRRLHQIDTMKRKRAAEANALTHVSDTEHAVVENPGGEFPDAGSMASSAYNPISDAHHEDDNDFSTLTLDDINLDALIAIVTAHSMSHHQLVKLIALQWMKHLLIVGHSKILAKYNAEILRAVMCSISHKEEKIRRAASEANQQLQVLVHYTAKSEEVQLNEIIKHIQFELSVNSITSRECALQWIRVLLDKDFDRVMEHIDTLFTQLLKSLKDSSQDVVPLVLDVLASMASTAQHFSTLIYHLLNLFCIDKKLMSKAGFLIRQLSGILNTERLFREISLALRREPFGEERREFSSLMVQTLNMILLTSEELSQVRNFIRGKRASDETAKSETASTDSTTVPQEDLFTTLYKTWSFNPVSTLSLCLLAKKYRHASLLVQSFSQMEMTVNFLVHIDNLVQLLESPIFVELRMQLLEPHQHPYLLKTLYGILMLLPQSSAYDKLNKRLQSISAMYFVAQSTRAVLAGGESIGGNVNGENVHKDQLDTENQEYHELLNHFKMLHCSGGGAEEVYVL